MKCARQRLVGLVSYRDAPPAVERSAFSRGRIKDRIAQTVFMIAHSEGGNSPIFDAKASPASPADGYAGAGS